MNAVGFKDRIFHTLSDYAYPVGGAGAAIAVAGLAASSILATITGLCLAAIAAVVRYLYPLLPRNNAAALPPPPQPNLPPQAAQPPANEHWDFTLEAPSEQTPRVETTASWKGQEYRISLRHSPTKDKPAGYQIFINDLPVVNASATTDLTNRDQLKKPLASRQWILDGYYSDTNRCLFRMVWGTLHVQTAFDNWNNIGNAPAMLSRDLEAASDQRYYEVFSARKMIVGFNTTVAPFRMTQQEAEKIAEPHLQKSDFAVSHLKTALVACVNVSNAFFYQAAPEDNLRRVASEVRGNVSWCFWNRYEVTVCDGYSFEVQLQVESDGQLTVWFNDSPGQFLPGSALQTDSLQRARRDITEQVPVLEDLRKIIFGYYGIPFRSECF